MNIEGRQEPDNEPQDQSRQDRYTSPVRAVITGIGDLFRKPAGALTLEGLPSLDGKKVMITGASSGLGFATAVELARRGALVIMAVRSGIPEKGVEVKRRSGSEKVEMVRVDLADLSSLPAFVQRVKERFGTIDILVCNAAVVTRRSRQVTTGLDEMFAVNYFSKFLLINLMIESGCLDLSGQGRPRIVIVNSESHRNPAGFEWEKFGVYQEYGIDRSVAMYGYYKLLLLTMANELSRRLNPGGEVRCPVLALCPGPVNSNIAREAPKVFRPMLKLVFGIFFRSPRKACKPVIYMSASEEMEKRPVDYLFLMQRKPMDAKATAPANGRRLWDLSEQLRKRVF